MRIVIAALNPILELLIIIPGLLLAYLPVKQHLRMRPGRLAAILVVLSVSLCLVGGVLSYLLSIRTLWLFFPITAIIGLFYIHTLEVSHWKTISVFLAVCGVFSCIGGVANAIHILLCPKDDTLWLSLGAALSYHLMCWGFVILSWYPSTHAAKRLLADESFAQTWYVFWILPILFIGLNLFMLPIHPKLLFQGRLMQGYIVISLALLTLLLLFYVMFYLIAASLNRNDKLRQKNEFLSMQQSRYDSLRTAILETREARHDMRHHFHTLQSLAAREEWEKLTDYLSKAMDSLPGAELNLCENTAVDAVAGHYGMLFQKHKIPFSFALNLPNKLPIPEIDLCLTLSNLLENALEASLKTEPAKRQIRVHACLHSEHIVLISVENTFDGAIKEKNGSFQSSKRKGEGVGIQSIRRIAEKNDGYSQFLYGEGKFCANIMLQAKD